MKRNEKKIESIENRKIDTGQHFQIEYLIGVFFLSLSLYTRTGLFIALNLSDLYGV